MSDLHKAAVSSIEVNALLDQALAERGWPANPKEAARVGYEVGLREALAAPIVPQWVAVSEKMPELGVPVLACYTNRLGNTRRIRAFWTPANTTESGGDSDIGVYDEATDTYYDPAGWYECMDNWDEYSAIFVNEGEITHWMPLPAAPKPKEQTT